MFKKEEKHGVEGDGSNTAHEKANPPCWQVALAGLFVAKGIIIQEEVLEMVMVVNGEVKRCRG